MSSHAVTLHGSPTVLAYCTVLLQVQAAIGATKAVAFDLTAACSGFVVGLVTGSQFIRTGLYKNVLVVGADALSRFIDWRDRCELPVPCFMYCCMCIRACSVRSIDWQDSCELPVHCCVCCMRVSGFAVKFIYWQDR